MRGFGYLAAFLSVNAILAMRDDGGDKKEAPHKSCTEVVAKMDKNKADAFIPKCKADGSYEKKQCYFFMGMHQWCWCVDSTTGKQVPGTRKAKGSGGVELSCDVECAEHPCTKIHRPVCGSDDKTYDNWCMLRNAKCKNSTLKAVKRGTCKCAERPCTKIHRPVCGSDDKTYDNWCMLRNAKCKISTLKAVKRGPCIGAVTEETKKRPCDMTCVILKALKEFGKQEGARGGQWKGNGGRGGRRIGNRRRGGRRFGNPRRGGRRRGNGRRSGWRFGHGGGGGWRLVDMGDQTQLSRQSSRLIPPRSGTAEQLEDDNTGEQMALSEKSDVGDKREDINSVNDITTESGNNDQHAEVSVIPNETGNNDQPNEFEHYENNVADNGGKEIDVTNKKEDINAILNEVEDDNVMKNDGIEKDVNQKNEGVDGILNETKNGEQNEIEEDEYDAMTYEGSENDDSKKKEDLDAILNEPENNDEHEVNNDRNNGYFYNDDEQSDKSDISDGKGVVKDTVNEPKIINAEEDENNVEPNKGEMGLKDDSYSILGRVIARELLKNHIVK